MKTNLFLKILMLISCCDQVKSIIEGRFTRVGEFPHQVQLFYRDTYFCSGSIISQYMILTSAHCFVIFRNDLIDGDFQIENNLKYQWVVAGANKLSSSREKELYERAKTRNDSIQFRNILTYGMNSQYLNAAGRPQIERDIGLIFLKLPLKYNVRVQKISLSLNPLNISDLSNTVVLAGWGQTFLGKETASKKLKTVKGRISNMCWSLMKNNWEIVKDSTSKLEFGKPGRVLCVESKPGELLNKGDSGGAVLCFKKDDTLQKQPFLCGVLSWMFTHENFTNDLGRFSLHPIMSKENLEYISVNREGFNFRMKCDRSKYYYPEEPYCYIKEYHICRKGAIALQEAYLITEDMPEPFSKQVTSSSKCYRFVNCRIGQFRCFNGKCIDEKKLCDGKNNCNDVKQVESSDEDKCPTLDDARICTGDSLYYCGPGDRCIPAEWKCDGAVDCLTNSSDERADECFCFSDTYYFSVELFDF